MKIDEPKQLTADELAYMAKYPGRPLFAVRAAVAAFKARNAALARSAAALVKAQRLRP